MERTSDGKRLSVRDDIEHRTRATHGSAMTAGVAERPKTGGARPGSKGDPKAKKEKVERVPYAIATDPSSPGFAAVKDGKLTAMPADFDTRKNKPLSRKDFVDEATWFGVLADRHQRSADALRRRAEESKKLGGLKDKGKAKRLLKMRAVMLELEKSLREQLGDAEVDSFLKTAVASADAAPKA